jgi:hypothetical protein
VFDSPLPFFRVVLSQIDADADDSSGTRNATFGCSPVRRQVFYNRVLFTVTSSNGIRFDQTNDIFSLQHR